MSLDNRLRLLLFACLLGIYLLVYTPNINSADGMAMLAVTKATLEHGQPEIGVMGASEALLPLPMSRMGAFGVDGALYSKKGPTPSVFLIPFVAIADALPGLQTRAVAMLFNPLVTTITALLLFTLLRWLNYKPRTALVTAFVYGVATFAITYVKSLFGEPLTALLLLLGVMAAYRYRQGVGHKRNLLLIGCCLGLMIGINLIYIITVPVVGLFIFVTVRDKTIYVGEYPFFPGLMKRAIWAEILTFAFPIAITLILLGLYNWVRFGSPMSSGYHFADGEGFTRPIITGLFGLTISPYRGLFWYSPVLLLALPGWLMLRRTASWLAWLALTLVIAQAASFAGWWSWHGGIVWGPRFLIPVIPLTVLFLAPLIESAWTRRLLAGVLAAFIALSLFVQLLGSLYSFFHYTGYLFVNYYTGIVDSPLTAMKDEVLYNPGLSPVLGHLALLITGWPLEPAWLAHGVDILHLLAALVLMLTGVAVAVVKMARRLPYILVALVALASMTIVAGRQNQGREYDEVQALAVGLQPPGWVAVASTHFGDSLVDLKPAYRVMGMNAPTKPDDLLAAPSWNYLMRQHGNLWFVTWFPPVDTANWQEHDLWGRAAFAVERTIAGHRALLFNLDSPPVPDTPAGYRFGDIKLDTYGVSRTSDGLFVTVQWSTSKKLTDNDGWFIHVLDATGNIVAQQDRQPQGGYAPTSGWTPGQPVLDRLYFPGTSGDNLRLRIGFVNPANGERLPAFGSDGVSISDGFILLPVP